MSHARYLVGDVFDRMAQMPDGSIDLVLTSPPFLALRSYLPADHPDKGKEIGSEPTPAAFLDTLLALTAEWRRLLAPHGSICVELGDTYSGSGGAGGDYAEGGLRDGQQAFSGSAAKRRKAGVGDDYRPSRVGRRSQFEDPKYPGRSSQGSGGNGWPLAKSMCGIPHLYHLSLAYGRNILTGEPSPAGEWIVRNVVAWCRPNPAPGATGDKFKPAMSFVTIATLARDRYWDGEAVREPASPNTNARTAAGVEAKPNTTKSAEDPRTGGNRSTLATIHTSGDTRPAYDWWEVATKPYPGSHYAVWPAALLDRPIRSMVPARVCTVCGEPSRRMVDVEPSPMDPEDRVQRTDDDAGRSGPRPNGRTHMGIGRRATTTGWTDCACQDLNKWRNGIVLDPFAGSGTTLAVATGHGRDCIGIDLDERNADLARERVGMFLDVEFPEAVA